MRVDGFTATMLAYTGAAFVAEYWLPRLGFKIAGGAALAFFAVMYLGVFGNEWRQERAARKKIREAGK